MPESIAVLHVEDNADFAAMTAEFLQTVDERVDLTTETDPTCALSRLRADPSGVDCVISDYDMPGMNGIEFLKAVRKEWPKLPFILFTGKGSEEVASEAISAGVSEYLQKGGGTDTYQVLAHRIQNVIERQEARREAARAKRVLEKTVERATDMIAIVDASQDITFASGSVKRILGYSPAEVKSLGPFELIHPDDREVVQDQFSRRLSDPGNPTGITFRARYKDGQYVQMNARAYNMMDDPDINGVLIYARRASETE